MNAIVWIVVALAVVGLYVWYATIVKRRNRVAEALSGIDVQLAQRHELIPNVLAIAKRYLAHEQTLLADIARLRTTGQERLGSTDPKAIAEKFETENQLTAGLGRLFAVAEGYPDLKSDALMVPGPGPPIRRLRPTWPPPAASTTRPSPTCATPARSSRASSSPPWPAPASCHPSSRRRSSTAAP